ncbi:tannase and feruloyl esterase [Lophiostoma macrostomum CBS 122681]|uniref:Carboxylic ester hydrolase n=1 Tax=Lophiostoma macrostomum CBS 122681 TaxID=1314788 RepID=A0A6A6SK53_9PLEO|nr:tannase and feruloyl esterase [Lophiostoma macrostomum CBS 122681]
MVVGPFLSNLTFAIGTPAVFPACNAQSIPSPDVAGVNVTSISAVPYANYSGTNSVEHAFTKTVFSNLNFCNITVTYTHPGRNDQVVTTVLLPELSAWNGRFLGTGGAGWSANLGDGLLVPPLNLGFAVGATDGGVEQQSINTYSSSGWALDSVGNPDLNRLNTWASQAIHEIALIGKDVVASYYNRSAAYSYYTGCSGGGRQSLHVAQRYPNDYDGIAALAPAINWAQFFPTMQWGIHIMDELDYVPPPCELLAFQALATEACDPLDGLTDGVISSPELCDFDPFSVVGSSYACDGANATFSEKGAIVMHAAWTGPRSAKGDFLWWGYQADAPLGTSLMNTTCASPNNCTATRVALPDDWFKYWLAADPALDLAILNRTSWTNYFMDGVERYDSVIGTRWADLSRFRDAGGKILTWHGLADEYIPFNGSVNYYDRVKALDASVDDYYRLFLVPGVEHCFPGAGPYPVGTLDVLMDWVEKGVVPEQLIAQNLSNLDPATGQLSGSANETAGLGRPICLYPKRQVYLGGDPSKLASFECIEPAGAL